MVNQATGVSQKDVGKKAIISGYVDVGTVVEVLGRTVRLEIGSGYISVDQDAVYLKERN